MLGIPGTAASQATILDGYPLAQKGQAARALGAAFTVSAFGGVFGAAYSLWLYNRTAFGNLRLSYIDNFQDLQTSYQLHKILLT